MSGCGRCAACVPCLSSGRRTHAPARWHAATLTPAGGLRCQDGGQGARGQLTNAAAKGTAASAPTSAAAAAFAGASATSGEGAD